MAQLEIHADQLDSAVDSLRQGGFVLLHDSVAREDEVDMIVAGELILPKQVETMRIDAGGLVCLALGWDAGKKLGIPTMHDILLFASQRYPVLKSLNEETAPYGGKSAFSITVNHKRTFTGVTDSDRALTIAELAKVSKLALQGGTQEKFESEFKAPGHVHLLLESKRSLQERRGHTELSVYLCRLAGLAPAAAICEMLDAETHNALSVEDAKEYAESHFIPFIDGQQVVNDFLKNESERRSFKA